MRWLTVTDDDDSLGVIVMTSYETVAPAVIILAKRTSGYQALAIGGDELDDLRLLLQVGQKMLSGLSWPEPGQAA